jgi:hypothetical protein
MPSSMAPDGLSTGPSSRACARPDDTTGAPCLACSADLSAEWLAMITTLATAPLRRR